MQHIFLPYGSILQIRKRVIITRAKTVAQSYTEQVHIVMPEHINGNKRLFGGRLLEWIDVVAGVVARRHSECEVTTACIDHLEFLSDVRVSSTIVLKGKITYVGTTSMEVRIDTFVEHLDGTRAYVNKAFLVMVALDENQRPTPVPSLHLQTEQEIKENEQAKKRKIHREWLAKYQRECEI